MKMNVVGTNVTRNQRNRTARAATGRKAATARSTFLTGSAQVVHAKEASMLARRCRGRRQERGGALGLQMNIFDRVSRVVRSYVNAVITAAEDPEK